MYVIRKFEFNGNRSGKPSTSALFKSSIEKCVGRESRRLNTNRMPVIPSRAKSIGLIIIKREIIRRLAVIFSEKNVKPNRTSEISERVKTIRLEVFEHFETFFRRGFVSRYVKVITLFFYLFVIRFVL